MATVKDSGNREVEIQTEDCSYCNGNSSVKKSDGNMMTSQEWCTEQGTCAATIDWDQVYQRD